MSAREAGKAAAVKVYERFHQADPGEDLHINVPGIPANMTLLGQAEELVYSVPSGVPSKRANVRWRHRWGDEGEGNDTHVKPLVLANPEEDGVLVLITPPGKKKFTITSRGLVG